MNYFVTLAVLLSIIALVNGTCQRPTIEQHRSHYWIENDRYYSLWYVKINNPHSGDILNKIFLDIHPRDPSPYQLWSLEQISTKRYRFPNDIILNGVQGGQSHEFGYIVASTDSSYPPLNFIIYDYACPASDSCYCTLEYKPVCGEDDNTYSNNCNARCEGVLKVKEGEC